MRTMVRRRDDDVQEETMTQSEPTPVAGRPVVLRGGTVLTMDGSCTVLDSADVLVVDDRIAAVGPALEVPEGTQEIDARGGIVMPGMIDTHRHMWQTAMRGYGADWTLTQYFVWYYLEHGKRFRPEDVAAGNRLSALEAIESGVTTTVDWSHGLQTVDHAEAAVAALRSVPGRFVLAYGNIQAAPWEWTADPAVRAFLERHRDAADDSLGLQLAFDVTGDPAFPEKAAFEVARELGLPVTTHAGVWGATNDDGIRLMHEHGFMTPETVYVHAATLTPDSYHRIAATGGSISVSTESEQSAGQGYPPTWQVRSHGIPVSLSMDTSVWWSGDLFSAMRTTLGADRSREHFEAHLAGDTVTHLQLRAQDVVQWATRGGALALGRDDLGSLEPGKKADVVLIKNDASPVSFPLLNPFGHVAFQAQRGDVHTVLVDGRVVKHAHRLVDVDLAAVREEIEATVEHLRGAMGEAAWAGGMYPDLPDAEVLDNPYQYTDYRSHGTHAAREQVFEEHLATERPAGGQSTGHH
ncbi:amidohydrolase family protein [Blastococcus sp. VKM Ac-2987]|uniref:amidohydrolase family protein n=1 Tax=Blastococcus sp. VKM Ac-2987 TaxID=3004141 RepID=UPI0022AB6BC4|nr:amidohydrolase family protein [Blastococcus sp. VKM Ac-2987]MCZ2860428.1 amidohydrolase family protein [Blastococcus sp. VKM Ac-2987]